MAETAFLTSAAAMVLATIWARSATRRFASARLRAEAHPEKVCCQKTSRC